ncbi:hypothetical protein N7486_000123 [Penicillium sp. IBT 16267x]|nr:hypothetical protein N7486_000123 [Penicillium sp. IBT 16267x]
MPSTMAKIMAPIKYNSMDHPLFNPQRVPRVLQYIEETRSMMEMMRGLYLKPHDQQGVLKYQFYDFLRGWINPRKARCCRCFLLKKNFRTGASSKKDLEFLQEASRRYKGMPQEDSALTKSGGNAKCACHSTQEGECETHKVPVTNDGKDQFVSVECETEHGVFKFQVLEPAESERGQFGRGMSRIPNCLYHPGEARDDVFTCCNQSTFTRGCVLRWNHVRDLRMEGNPDHDPSHPGDGLEWKLKETPDKFPIPPNARSGLVLALKTGINRWGEQELIRVSAVDLYSGEVLIDNLVWPKNPLLHLDSGNSCITWPMMHDARAKGLCFEGREAALERLWDFVTPNTYLVLHEGQRDMIHLRWVHRKVIDTHELEGRLWASKGNRSLKRLSMVHLKRNIQHGRFGLDSLEDAMACRDLVFWYGKNLPPDKRQDDHEPLIKLGHWRPGEWEQELMEYECRILMRIRAYQI